jgi:hypothetical protein
VKGNRLQFVLENRVPSEASQDYFRGVLTLTKGQPGKSIKSYAGNALSRWLLLL